MNLAQSPYVPETGKRPRLNDLPWLVLFAMRGLLELVRARLIFERLEAKVIPRRNNRALTLDKTRARVTPAKLARIAYVIPRLSDRLPWRSDCLIQAIAAQNWLLASGMPSEIQIGVENPKDGQFGAHAWLICGESVVTGGDISQYAPILVESNRD